MVVKNKQKEKELEQPEITGIWVVYNNLRINNDIQKLLCNKEIESMFYSSICNCDIYKFGKKEVYMR